MWSQVLNLLQFVMTDDLLRLKIMMTGNSGSGTSCLSLRYTEDRFQPQHLQTIGVQYHTKALYQMGVKLQIWEAAGGQRFRAITRSYYRDAHGIIITYSITDRYSFQSVQRWYREIEDVIEGIDAGTTVYIVGTHLDQADRREVTYEQGQQLALSLDCKFYEVSSLEGTNVVSMFQQLTGDMLKNSVALEVNEFQREKSMTRLWKAGEIQKTCC